MYSSTASLLRRSTSTSGCSGRRRGTSPRTACPAWSCASSFERPWSTPARRTQAARLAPPDPVALHLLDALRQSRSSRSFREPVSTRILSIHCFIGLRITGWFPRSLRPSMTSSFASTVPSAGHQFTGTSAWCARPRSSSLVKIHCVRLCRRRRRHLAVPVVREAERLELLAEPVHVRRRRQPRVRPRLDRVLLGGGRTRPTPSGATRCARQRCTERRCPAVVPRGSTEDPRRCGEEVDDERRSVIRRRDERSRSDGRDASSASGARRRVLTVRRLGGLGYRGGVRRASIEKGTRRAWGSIRGHR